MGKLESARERLAAHRAELSRLEALTFELVGDVRKEEDAHSQRTRRSDWESERVFDTGLRLVATWPEPTASGVSRWFVGAGTENRLLAVWEVREYRGRYARLIHGSAPLSVRVDAFRVFELKEPGT